MYYAEIESKSYSSSHDDCVTSPKEEAVVISLNKSERNVRECRHQLLFLCFFFCNSEFMRADQRENAFQSITK